MNIKKILLSPLVILLYMTVKPAAFAYDGFYSAYGLPVFDKHQISITEVKEFNVGYQHSFIGVLDQKLEGGFWIDTRIEPDRKSSIFAAWSFGPEAATKNFYIHTFVGFLGITSPDSYLGSYYQFTEDVGIGFQGDNKVRYGFNLKHISNAGIKRPNDGRNFFQLRIQLPF